MAVTFLPVDLPVFGGHVQESPRAVCSIPKAALYKKQVRITALDVIVGLLVTGIAAYVLYRIRVGLHYKWNWSAIPQYLFRYDPERGKWVANLLTHGLYTTIRLSIWGMLFGMIIGTAMGFFRVSNSLFKRLVGRTFVELIRNIPPLVLVFIFYFFVSDQIMPIFGVDEFVRSRTEATQSVLAFLFAPPQLFAPFISAAITIGFLEAAYIAEIVRAGIASIEKGQWEASCALGLSWRHQMRDVILPQAFQRILPPLAGQFISTIKDSAIVSVISIQELTFQGLELIAATYLTIECWITITVLYLLLTLSLSLAVSRLETHMRRGES